MRVPCGGYDGERGLRVLSKLHGKDDNAGTEEYSCTRRAVKLGQSWCIM